jgi:hypothetical protein
MKQSSSSEVTQQRNFPPFMESEGSLLFSQELAISKALSNISQQGFFCGEESVVPPTPPHTHTQSTSWKYLFMPMILIS